MGAMSDIAYLMRDGDAKEFLDVKAPGGMSLTAFPPLDGSLPPDPPSLLPQGEVSSWLPLYGGLFPLFFLACFSFWRFSKVIWFLP
jgi:hypothetical protein